MAATSHPAIRRTAASASGQRAGPRDRVRERRVRSEDVGTWWSCARHRLQHSDARPRARSHGGEVEYRFADATDAEALIALGDPASFDAVVSNMAIMDMESIEPMAEASAALLRPGGRFVFSTLHPAFNSGNARPTVEIDPHGSSTEVYSVRVSAYGQPATGRGVAIAGQPVEQWYFHRPLWMILEPFFARGFALDGLDEPLLGRDHGEPGTPMYAYTQVPDVLVGRMRRSTSPHRFPSALPAHALLTTGRQARARNDTRRHRTTRRTGSRA